MLEVAVQDGEPAHLHERRRRVELAERAAEEVWEGRRPQGKYERVSQPVRRGGRVAVDSACFKITEVVPGQQVGNAESEWTVWCVYMPREGLFPFPFAGVRRI